jgi:hypothetical protein
MSSGAAIFFTALLKYGVPALIVIGIAALIYYLQWRDK